VNDGIVGLDIDACRNAIARLTKSDLDPEKRGPGNGTTWLTSRRLRCTIFRVFRVHLCPGTAELIHRPGTSM
jgi:hypothetical protein